MDLECSRALCVHVTLAQLLDLTRGVLVWTVLKLLGGVVGVDVGWGPRKQHAG